MFRLPTRHFHRDQRARRRGDVWILACRRSAPRTTDYPGRGFEDRFELRLVVVNVHKVGVNGLDWLDHLACEHRVHAGAEPHEEVVALDGLPCPQVFQRLMLFATRTLNGSSCAAGARGLGVWAACTSSRPSSACPRGSLGCIATRGAGTPPLRRTGDARQRLADAAGQAASPVTVVRRFDCSLGAPS